MGVLDLENNMLSTREFRNYLLKRASKEISDCCTISNRDLYRANWSINKFILELELYLGRRLDCKYIHQMDYWVVYKIGLSRK